jgi:hypothetical protein
MITKILISYFLSNLLTVVYDAIYKALTPYASHRHKPYLDGRGGGIMMQLLFSSFISIFRCFRILRGLNIYRIKLLLRAIIQISFGCLIYTLMQ